MWRARVAKLRRKCWLEYKTNYIYIANGKVVRNRLVGDYVVDKPMTFRTLKKFLKYGTL